MSSIDDRLGLTGKRVWVVGAGGGGIGTAVSTELAEAGAHVLAIDRNPEALEVTLEKGKGTPGSIEAHVLDASDRSALAALAELELRKEELPIGLVNIVGGLQREQFGAILDTNEETLDAVLSLNLRVSWLASQVFARMLFDANQTGSIVHLASIVALQGMPFGAPYAMAKAALISLCRTQALEWGPHGLRVNTIAAGTIRTPRAVSDHADLDRRVIPLGRRGDGQDISGAALFLLSDLAGFVTGQVLAVDGGASIKPAYLGDDGLPVFVEDDALRKRLFGNDESTP